MGRQKNARKALAVLGAGPKALAIGAKAQVLEQLGFISPRLYVIEKAEVAHHWKAGSGYTNGRLPLGTAPDKDIGFPYYSFCWGDRTNKRVNFLMQRYSWQNFLISHHLFADWVDRGRPSPIHSEWANYLEWVHQHIVDSVSFVKAEVTAIDLEGEKWALSCLGENGEEEILVDGVVFTGPGDTVVPFDLPDHDRVYDFTRFWRNYRLLTEKREKRFALIGAGENAATIAVTLAQADPSSTVDIISPNATNYTRGESYVENHLYTDPFQGNWHQLTVEDRRNFIARTDRGVFSVTTKRQLDSLRNVEVIPGLCRGARIDSLDQLLVKVEYNHDHEERRYDYLILTIGFNPASFAERLLTERAKAAIEKAADLSDWSASSLEERIGENLELLNVTPTLHLPMLSGLNQGPGFANLSCLGRLSDHILAKYIALGSAVQFNEPILLSLTDAEMNFAE